MLPRALARFAGRQSVGHERVAHYEAREAGEVSIADQALGRRVRRKGQLHVRRVRAGRWRGSQGSARRRQATGSLRSPSLGQLAKGVSGDLVPVGVSAMGVDEDVGVERDLTAALVKRRPAERLLARFSELRSHPLTLRRSRRGHGTSLLALRVNSSQAGLHELTQGRPFPCRESSFADARSPTIARARG